MTPIEIRKMVAALVREEIAFAISPLRLQIEAVRREAQESARRASETISHSDLTHQAEQGAMIAHQRKIEKELSLMRTAESRRTALTIAITAVTNAVAIYFALRGHP